MTAAVRFALASVTGLLAAVLMPIAVPALLPAASAHDTLTSSVPAAGESLEQAPGTLELTYSDEVLNLSPVVRLTNSAGEEISTAVPTISDNTASIELPPLPADAYQAQWRVVSSDGHPIEGTIDFTVTVGTGANDATNAGSDDADPTAVPDEPSTQATSTDQAEVSQAEGGFPIGMAFGGIGLLLALALIGAIIVRTRRNSGHGAD